MAYIFSDAVEFLDVCGDPGCASALVHSHKKRKPAGNDGLISANFALIFHFQVALLRVCMWPYYICIDFEK